MNYNIKNFPKRLYTITKALCKEVPSTAGAIDFIDRLVEMLYPVRSNQDARLGHMEKEWQELQVQLLGIITPLCKRRNSESGHCCKGIVDRFFAEIPLMYVRSMKDAMVYNESDPASDSIEEVILCYPGFYAVIIYRLSHILYQLEVPILPRIISEYAHSKTGIDIHPGAVIGKQFYIDHGTGVVIGETTVIGNNVKIYQGVTLGAKFVSRDLNGVKRHPTIEDNVIIYAGSTILGGETVVGKNSIIGGNVWLTSSLAEGSTVYHTPTITIKDDKR